MALDGVDEASQQALLVMLDRIRGNLSRKV